MIVAHLVRIDRNDLGLVDSFLKIADTWCHRVNIDKLRLEVDLDQHGARAWSRTLTKHGFKAISLVFERKV